MIPEEKAKIRTLVKERKSSYTMAELETLSVPPLFGIKTNSSFIQAKKVGFYWSLPDEVFTHRFIEQWKLKKEIYLPLTNDDQMKFVQFTDISEMQEGAYHVMEPSGKKEIEANELDVIIVPGVAFDESGNRLGRGKGYYDQFLNSITAPKLGLAFSFQMFETIPTEEHDIKLDKVIF